tara:strand:- start:449 stop:685 length:237 start_codon:yes stop_codon:yes gene_type:complete
MNLFLRPLENPNDPVWSVIISLIILLAGTFYYIYTIMTMAYGEMNEPDPSPAPENGVVDEVIELTGLEKINTDDEVNK